MNDVADIKISTNVPSINIVTDDATLVEIPSRDYYCSGKIAIDGYGCYEDLKSTAVNIKGRGNTSWNWPKKPYRLKFDKKKTLCGLKSKNFCLIANYIDGSVMRNAVAFEMARALNMPYTNHAIPVNVYFNDIYKGTYMLTEKLGINSGSINDIDDDKGILFELDSNYDEPYKFRSDIFGLPVMVKDPDFDEIAADMGTTPDALLEKWKDDFHRFEYALAPDSIKQTYKNVHRRIENDSVDQMNSETESNSNDNQEDSSDDNSEDSSEDNSEAGSNSGIDSGNEDNSGAESEDGSGDSQSGESGDEPIAGDGDDTTVEWTGDFVDYIDIESLVNYLIVCNVCANSEPHHPKSVYLYKETIDSKYKVGPVWDFDWAFMYANSSAMGRLFNNNDNKPGYYFFVSMLKDSRVKTLYEEKWAYFVENIYPQILEFIDQYAAIVEPSAALDGAVWDDDTQIDCTQTSKFSYDIVNLKEWLANRVDYISSSSNFGLYRE